MKILVTGGAGFIGSNLVDNLLNDGHIVTVYDDFSTGHRSNLDHIFNEIPERRLVLLNEPSYAFLDKYDLIYHLGMPSTSPLYRSDKLNIVKALDVTIGIFNHAIECGCPVVYASSSSLYNRSHLPSTEKADIGAYDYYTEVRYWIERLAKVYKQHEDLHSIGLRLFSVYGKNDWKKGKYANLITQMIIAAKQKKPFVLYENGMQSRDLTYINDVVNAFKLAGKYILRQDMPQAKIYNIGTGEQVFMIHAAKMISGFFKHELGYKTMPLIFEKNPIRNYVMHTQADIKKAFDELGFDAKYDLFMGLQNYLQVEDWEEAIKNV